MNSIRVVCGIILKDGKVLAAQRSESMSLPLKWEFPGGKLSDEESEEDALKRELFEELNIHVFVGERLSNSIYDYGKVIIDLIPFLATHIDGELIVREHRQIVWCTSKDLQLLDWAPADVPIVKELIRMGVIA